MKRTPLIKYIQLHQNEIKENCDFFNRYGKKYSYNDLTNMSNEELKDIQLELKSILPKKERVK